MSENRPAQHNHVTRNFLPRGKCPGCDAYYERHGGLPPGPAVGVAAPLPPQRQAAEQSAEQVSKEVLPDERPLAFLRRLQDEAERGGFHRGLSAWVFPDSSVARVLYTFAYAMVQDETEAVCEGEADAVLARVRALHARRPHSANGGVPSLGFSDFVAHGQSEFPDLCDHCRTNWPCDTATALGLD